MEISQIRSMRFWMRKIVTGGPAVTYVRKLFVKDEQQQSRQKEIAHQDEHR